MKTKKKTSSALKIKSKKHEKAESSKFEKKEKKMPGYKDKD